jgi:hypothetical protein
MMVSAVRGAVLLVALAMPSSVLSQTAIEWSRYTDPEVGFSVDLPLGLFEPLDTEVPGGLTLAEVGGSGQLSIYSGPATGLTLDEFAARLSAGEQVRSITYQVGGNSWFVLSGFYGAEGQGVEPLIFYSKVLMSPDHETFAAFEISYDEDDKARFDPIVDRIEASFKRPR